MGSAHLLSEEKWKLQQPLKRSVRSSSSSSSFPNGSSNSSAGKGRRAHSLATKCARLVKEQRARFYIMRRCVTMLICWRSDAQLNVTTNRRQILLTWS